MELDCAWTIKGLLEFIIFNYFFYFFFESFLYIYIKIIFYKKNIILINFQTKKIPITKLQTDRTKYDM